MHPILVPSPIVYDGDKQPKHLSGKLFLFAVVPSSDHILKIDSSSSLECTIVKSMKVPEPSYGIFFTVIIPRSILKKLYEVKIFNFPACTYRGFWYMCPTLGNPSKWILCKHLYFIL